MKKKKKNKVGKYNQKRAFEINAQICLTFSPQQLSALSEQPETF